MQKKTPEPTPARPRERRNTAESAAGETLATRLYRSVKQDIIRGELAPNQWLRIDQLRERYDAGASPLREALNRLSSEGLVVQKDQRGFVVADINEADLDELVYTRCSLNAIMIPEILARGDQAWEDSVVLAHYHLSKTAPFATGGQVNDTYLTLHRAFHMTILAPCPSRWLLELSAKLFDWTERYQNLALRADMLGTRDVASEHNELVKTILARDVEKSVQLMDEHVRLTRRLAITARAAALLD